MKILEAAAEWGCPPWELAPGGKALWFERWNANREAKIKIDKEKQLKAERQRNGRKS